MACRFLKRTKTLSDGLLDRDAVRLNTHITPLTALDRNHNGKEYARFNNAGELLRPTDYREWGFVGSRLLQKT